MSSSDGVLHDDLVIHDLSIALQMIAAVRAESQERQYELRHRCLALVLDGMRLPDSDERALPGPHPTWQDMSAQWNPQRRSSEASAAARDVG